MKLSFHERNKSLKKTQNKIRETSTILTESVLRKKILKNYAVKRQRSYIKKLLSGTRSPETKTDSSNI